MWNFDVAQNNLSKLPTRRTEPPEPTLVIDSATLDTLRPLARLPGASPPAQTQTTRLARIS